MIDLFFAFKSGLGCFLEGRDFSLRFEGRGLCVFKRQQVPLSDAAARRVRVGDGFLMSDKRFLVCN